MNCSELFLKTKCYWKMQNCSVDSKDGYVTSVLVFARKKGMFLLSANTVKISLNIRHRYSAPDI